MTSHGPVTRDLLQTFEDVRSRTFARLDGLTDAEYLWEPVAFCMTLRPAADGMFRADPRPGGEVRPAPFTTIGWRIWHIGADCLRGYGRFFGDDPQSDDRHLWPGTASEGVQELANDWSRFRNHVESLGDDRLLQPMGPIAGDYGHESYLLLALHALDEAAHHGAELGVLRDLYLHGVDMKQRANHDESSPAPRPPSGA
ncbi:DinB family protein [Streptomyces mirabilis]|uniref:DinB family protein n=1 Tax=Streptomyces mirabilis TaxID=68239 RepID=UPI002E29EC81|nr:DinB family protein [Streptomyces mirabilis]